MAKIQLSDFKVKNLKAADTGKRYDVMDSEVRGFGIRVNDKGERSFIYYSRFPGSASPQRRALGEYPAMSLADARAKAAAWRDLIRAGIDPKIKEDEERQDREREAAGKKDRRFETVLDRYIKARRRDGIRKVDEDERDFYRECLPTLYESNKGKKGVKTVWEGRDVASISSADIMAVVEPIAERGKQRQALNIAQKIGTFFSWCVDDEVIEVSPYRAKKVRTAIGEKKSRDRVLTDAEIRAFWTATETLGTVYREVYRLLLLTGQRLNDIAEASWPEIDMEKQVLTVPAARFKSERDHTVPLTDDAIANLNAVPTYKGCKWVFSLDSEHAATIGHKIKQRLDKAMLEVLRKDDPEATLTAWVNHDLRRTVRTRLSELDVMDEVAEAVIGHVPTALVRTYNQSDRLKVKRDALTRWEGALRSIVGNAAPDNVVPLRGVAQ
jgi:integrase